MVVGWLIWGVLVRLSEVVLFSFGHRAYSMGSNIVKELFPVFLPRGSFKVTTFSANCRYYCILSPVWYVQYFPDMFYSVIISPNIRIRLRIPSSFSWSEAQVECYAHEIVRLQ